MSAVLERPTLVLNKSWQPIHVTSVYRSLSLIWSEHAKVVDDNYVTYNWDEWLKTPVDHKLFIRTSRSKVPVPEVICLTYYDKLPGKAVTYSRRNIAKRDHHTCQYCNKYVTMEEMTIDHVIPKSQGGLTNWENCVVACMLCNRLKDNRTPEQAGFRLNSKPIRPHWRTYFESYGSKINSWSKFMSQ